ncbi:MAG TPA: DUF885 family protein [Fimbriimonas sp.]|nr:DUF885 family protein [Fimbriimonas sp.]
MKRAPFFVIALCLQSAAWGLVRQESPSMADVITRFEADERSVGRKYDLEYSAEDRRRMGTLYDLTLTDLKKIDFDHLSTDGKVDYVFLRTAIENRQAELKRQQIAQDKIAAYIPFAGGINRLEIDRRNVVKLDYEDVANRVAALARQVKDAERALRSQTNVDKVQAYRVYQALDSFSRTLAGWHRFYESYDPLFTWWVPTPYKALTDAIASYRKFLAENVLSIREGDPTILLGDPIGRDALIDQLQGAMIDYTPEELIAIAEKEYAWSEVEMKKASNQMGFGDDWRKALEKVKTEHLAPGEEPQLIKQMAEEATEYVTKNNLVTVPPLAAETWTMEMMSPQRQLLNPFFTGGLTINVSFPTAEMSQEQKEMSLKANNRWFDRATVFHELIPGHSLQAFMEPRYHPYRGRLEGNPFWIEGWSFYWEMLLYNTDFVTKPEERIGMLFWRMHRSARVVFSLKFQLGEWTPQQCVDYLITKVGHDPFTAEGEVRRSIVGEYSPLYQLAYMMGALQFRQLHHDLVDSHKMTNKEFHDRILQGNQLPIELVRAMLGASKLTRDYKTQWKFYGG